MKKNKIFYALLACINFATLAMENSEESVKETTQKQETIQVKKIAKKKQPSYVKSLLKEVVDYNNKGEKEKRLATIGYLNMNDKEPIRQATFKELMQERQELSLIIARVASKEGSQYPVYNYYDAYSLFTIPVSYINAPQLKLGWYQRHMFQDSFKDPLTGRTILDFIELYIPGENGLHFIGTDQDLFIKKDEMLNQTYLANNPYPQNAEQNTNKIIAQAYLAHLYSGFYNPNIQDYKKAWRYYTLLEKQTISPYFKTIAQYNLGCMFYDGHYVQQNYLSAKEYFEKVEQQEEILNIKKCSQFYLGKLYLYGNGIEKDTGKALEYFEKAESQNEDIALKELAKAEIDKINQGPQLEKRHKGE